MEYEIDKLLGDYRQRYFGSGYKKIGHDILTFQRNEDGWNGKAKISRVKDWSVKKTGHQLDQHLSSIDILVISVLFSGKVIKKVFPEIHLESMILSKFTLKMGSAPVTNLNSIDIQVDDVHRIENYFLIQGKVENMHMELTFFYRTETDMGARPHKKTNFTFFEDHYKRLDNVIDQIRFDGKSKVDCRALVATKKTQDYIEIESDYSQYTSLLSWLVIFAQIAEVEAYHFDHITRDESANFWARKITATINVNKLYHLNSSVNVQLEIKKSQLLCMRGANWRTLTLTAHDINHLIEFKGKMAHQLLKEN